MTTARSLTLFVEFGTGSAGFGQVDQSGRPRRQRCPWFLESVMVSQPCPFPQRALAWRGSLGSRLMLRTAQVIRLTATEVSACEQTPLVKTSNVYAPVRSSPAGNARLEVFQKRRLSDGILPYRFCVFLPLRRITHLIAVLRVCSSSPERPTCLS